MKALCPTKTFAQLAQATNRFGTKAKNNCNMRPSADAMLVPKSAQSLLLMVTGDDMLFGHSRIHIFTLFLK